MYEKKKAIFPLNVKVQYRMLLSIDNSLCDIFSRKLNGLKLADLHKNIYCVAPRIFIF